MDTSVYDVMKTMRAEKAAAQALAAAKKAKTEPGLSPLSGKKRNHEEANNAQDGLSPSVVGTPPAAHGGVGGSVAGARSPPPGFSSQQQSQDGKPRQEPDSHDGDAADWEAARKLLQDLVTPSRSRVFAAAKPSDVVASSYVAMLQTANYASFSLGYAMELEEKLRDAAAEAGALQDELDKAKAELAEARKTSAEAGALRGELEKTKAELAEARMTTAAELEGAKAAAVHEFLASMENVRRLADHALEGYERGMDHMKRVALRLYRHIDAARLVVPPGGPPP